MANAITFKTGLSLSLVALVLLGVGLGPLLDMLIIRVLTLDGYGNYLTIFSLVALGTTLGRFGLGDYLMRTIPSKKSSSSKNITRASAQKTVYFQLPVVLTFFIFPVCLYIFSDFSLRDKMVIVFVTAGWVLFGTIAILKTEEARSLELFNLSQAVGQILPRVIGCFIIFFALWRFSKLSWELVCIIMMLCQLLIIITFFFKLPKGPPINSVPKINFADYYDFGLSSVSVVALQMSPIIVGRFFLSAEDVAFYGFAWKLSLIVSLPLVVVEKYLITAASKAGSLGEESKETIKLLIRRVRFFSLTGVSVASLTLLVGFEFVVESFYGTGYLDTFHFFVWLLVPVFVTCVTASPHLMLIGLGFQKFLFRVNTICVLISLGAIALSAASDLGIWGLIISVVTGRLTQQGVLYIKLKQIT